jgi:hypothetical protein
MRAVRSLIISNRGEVFGRMGGKGFQVEGFAENGGTRAAQLEVRNKHFHSFEVRDREKNAARLATVLSPNIPANDRKPNELPNDGPKLVKDCNRLASHKFCFVTHFVDVKYVSVVSD